MAHEISLVAVQLLHCIYLAIIALLFHVQSGQITICPDYILFLAHLLPRPSPNAVTANMLLLDERLRKYPDQAAGKCPALVTPRPGERPIFQASPTFTVVTSTRDSELIPTAMDSPFEQRIAEALNELQSSLNPSLRAVEKKYGVSRRTLQRCLNGGVSKQTARCSQQLLSAEQGELLVSWILMLETEGHAPTHATVQEMAGQISRISGDLNIVDNRWLLHFLTRHSDVYSKLDKSINVL